MKKRIPLRGKQPLPAFQKLIHEKTYPSSRQAAPACFFKNLYMKKRIPLRGKQPLPAFSKTYT
jgi:hypothetical protein